MSGQIRGKIDCLLNAATGTTSRINNTQMFFKNIWDFFTAHPNATEIARHNGAGGSPGTNYYDQANPFGGNAWFVFRLNATASRPFDTYHMFQWAGSPNQGGPAFGTSPGNPGLIRGTTNVGDNSFTYIGYQCAIGVGGTGGSGLSTNYGNPWNGAGSIGTSTKGSTVWVPPPGGGTSVQVWPRSNNLEQGAHATNKENYLPILLTNSDSAQRMNIVGDDDSFVIIWDLNDSNNNFLSLYSGQYTLRPGLPVGTEVYCVLANMSEIGLTSGVDYGDMAGTSNRQGGILTRVTGSPLVRIARVARLSDMYTTTFQPNHAFPVNRYDEFPFALAILENTSQQFSAYMGQTDFIRETFNIPLLSTNNDFSRAYFGGTSQATNKISIPWDTVDDPTPKNNNTRQGITFVNP